MFFLTKNDCIAENQWILKLFVCFLKKEKLLYKYDISFKLYNYLKFNENLNSKWFFENILIFLYLFVIPKDELVESMRANNDESNEHRINCQLWKFYLLDHFDEIKFIKGLRKDRFRQNLVNSIYKGGKFNDDRLVKLFSKHKIEK
jgi:hypothetical protein